MESLESLKAKKRDLESELRKITIVKHGSTPWAPGVLDQHKSESYSYEEYTDVDKAYRLKSQIKEVTHEIETYAERARAERARKEALIESQIPKYEYVAAGETNVTSDPSMAARYDAQRRFHGMGKVRQTLMTITGQKRKFEKLWMKAGSSNKQTQEEVAKELDKMFR